MTVKELINHLSQFPLDAVCIRSFCSDYDKMDEEQIILIEPKDGEGLIDHYNHVI